MRIKPEQLSQLLKKQQTQCFTIMGDEPLLSIEAADTIRHSLYHQGVTEREIFTVDHRFEWSKITQWSDQCSLFSTSKLLDLRIPTGKVGNDGNTALVTFLDNLSPDLWFMVTLPAIDKKSQASKWFTALDNRGVIVAIDSIERTQLPQWIQQRFHAQKQTIAPDALQLLVDNVEGNLLAAQQEILKLGLLYPEATLSVEQVRNAVFDVARHDVFDLPEAMLTGDIVRFTHMLENLHSEGVAPPLVLSILVDPLRKLLLLHRGVSEGKSLGYLFKEIRVWGQQQTLLSSAMKRYAPPLLMEGLTHAALIDKMIKGIKQGEIWDEFLQYGLRFAERSQTKSFEQRILQT